MAAYTLEAARNRLNLTATGTIAGNGKLSGFCVSQVSSGTIKVADANGTIWNTFTPTAGQYYPCVCFFSGGVTITITGTVDATFMYDR